jgi:hypothetical protein
VTLRATLTLLVTLSLSAIGCGADGGPEPSPPPPETPHSVPELRDAWEVHVNRGGGFALGLPPGWRARDRGTSTLIRSADRLVAVSIVPDRTREAVEIPLREFAERALAALPGYEGELEPARVRPVRHRYDGVRATTRAIAARTGVPQRVQVVVLRRGRHVTFTVVVAANVEGGRPGERVAEQMVRTLRSRPV